MGRIPILRPPASGGPSKTTACPLSDSPTNDTPSIHLTVTFIAHHLLASWAPSGARWPLYPLHWVGAMETAF